MSCFWDALIKHIKNEDLKIILQEQKISPINIVKSLINKNKIINTVKINNLELTEKQKTENLDHVKNYNIDTINNGYFCSTCDPFLILISDLLSITINNNYNQNIIEYKPIYLSRYTIFLKNTNSHME